MEAKRKRRRSLPRKSSEELKHLEVDGLLGALQDKIEDLRDEFEERKEAFDIDLADYQNEIDELENELAGVSAERDELKKQVKKLEQALVQVMEDTKDKKVLYITHPNPIVRSFVR